MVDDIEQRVIALITKHSSYYPFRKQKYDTFTAESNIHFDVQLDQDDVEELVVPDFTIDMFIKSAKAGKWLYD